jgi:hypothetical protein
MAIKFQKNRAKKIPHRAAGDYSMFFAQKHTNQNLIDVKMQFLYEESVKTSSKYPRSQGRLAERCFIVLLPSERVSEGCFTATLPSSTG